MALDQENRHMQILQDELIRAVQAEQVRTLRHRALETVALRRAGVPTRLAAVSTVGGGAAYWLKMLRAKVRLHAPHA